MVHLVLRKPKLDLCIEYIWILEMDHFDGRRVGLRDIHPLRSVTDGQYFKLSPKLDPDGFVFHATWFHIEP